MKPGHGRVVLGERDVELGRLEAIAGRLARALRPGELVLLFGPLGAGKTTLVRMLCSELGVTDPVRSPSFTIANVYAGPVTVNHLDLYRLEMVAAEDSLALEEYTSPDAITLVEWPEAGMPELGDAAWVVHMEHESLTTRVITIEVIGGDACARWCEAA